VFMPNWVVAFRPSAGLNIVFLILPWFRVQTGYSQDNLSPSLCLSDGGLPGIGEGIPFASVSLITSMRGIVVLLPRPGPMISVERVNMGIRKITAVVPLSCVQKSASLLFPYALI